METENDNHTIHNRGIILVENCGSKKGNESDQDHKDRKINAKEKNRLNQNRPFRVYKWFQTHPNPSISSP